VWLCGVCGLRVCIYTPIIQGSSKEVSITSFLLKKSGGKTLRKLNLFGFHLQLRFKLSSPTLPQNHAPCFFPQSAILAIVNTTIPASPVLSSMFSHNIVMCFLQHTIIIFALASSSHSNNFLRLDFFAP